MNNDKKQLLESKFFWLVNGLNEMLEEANPNEDETATLDNVNIDHLLECVQLMHVVTKQLQNK
ncbi:hypothetical protein P9027_32295 [Bacillus thuringiensis]|uniref:hypothetical protein n=1 Tax=Bacillus cereus group TaxID=86661 RepID=UPI002DBC6845|nr:hypothetical protein [Bacillus thuringiensis]MEC3226584.1 hypothetical protein [Bacillus thuringiensis]MEC3461693.1 hypothetical protein [Bacillus thuringiensis]MEC3553393.1 hypothetical protein [Bacillus thuringiensis]MED2059562.1 hypothetical protein [Bacillus thuringiensis]